jgi:hypothetical protein
MKISSIPSPQGYAIPLRLCWEGEKTVVLVSHGFGSSKASPMVQALSAHLQPMGVGVVSFDFPAHGDSPAGEEALRVPNCLADLGAVEEWIRAQMPGMTVHYFGSSFGAYITLLYLAARKERGDLPKAFLRSSAVTMPKLVESWVDEKAKEDLDTQGYFVPDYDYQREMRIIPAFLADLKANDVFARCRKGMARLQMVHGAKDDVAPAADARRFAQTFGAGFLELPQGEHPLMGPGELDTVLAAASEFFLEKPEKCNK